MLLNAGFVITSATDRPPSQPLPATVISVSDCIAAFLPGEWAFQRMDYGDDERLAAALEAGFSAGQLTAVLDWASEAEAHRRFRPPGVFSSLKIARDFIAKFQPRLVGRMLLGMGVTEGTAAQLVACGLVKSDSENSSLEGLFLERRALPPGGVMIGWEVIGVEHPGSCHSWLCNRVEVFAAQDLSTHPNSSGLIDDSRAAIAIAAACNSGKVACEPATWFPVAVLRYDPPAASGG